MGPFTSGEPADADNHQSPMCLSRVQMTKGYSLKAAKKNAICLALKRFILQLAVLWLPLFRTDCISPLNRTAIILYT
ncbi:unnamed protein product [Toxocara canis]|uniref:Uncharacterized protein n=1 Tax=Toxocara canis TaxID=6265 RepID=A0A183U929_TOXCA|nr:unnamed protein product [Toxocara canis]